MSILLKIDICIIILKYRMNIQYYNLGNDIRQQGGYCCQRLVTDYDYLLKNMDHFIVHIFIV